MLRGLALTLAVTASAALLPGCGSSSRSTASDIVQPAPITLADVSQAGVNTAAGAVLRLWLLGEWGAGPAVVSSYAPAAVAAAGGPSQIVAAYGVLQSLMITTHPKVVADVPNPDGTVNVLVAAANAGGPPTRESFILKRFGGKWLVVYDTLLLQGASTDTQQQVDGPAAPSTPRGVGAGLERERSLRLALSRLLASPSRP